MKRSAADALYKLDINYSLWQSEGKGSCFTRPDMWDRATYCMLWHQWRMNAVPVWRKHDRTYLWNIIDINCFVIYVFSINIWAPPFIAVLDGWHAWWLPFQLDSWEQVCVEVTFYLRLSLKTLWFRKELSRTGPWQSQRKVFYGIMNKPYGWCTTGARQTPTV